MKHDEKLIIEAIRHEEARLAALDEERRGVAERLQQLRARLTTPESEVTSATGSFSLTQADKITLFRSLFRGRDDVFPKLWTSKKDDRKGYMPACANDGNYTLCGKRKFPRIKCGVCDHQAYIPVSDEMIREHLQGKQTIGVYPLLPDDTCRFLAVDFDKTTWQEDVAAFRGTCSSLGVSVVVERSRSGNGAQCADIASDYFAMKLPQKKRKKEMADFIEEIGHVFCGSPGGTLGKIFFLTILVF